MIAERGTTRRRDPCDQTKPSRSR